MYAANGALTMFVSVMSMLAVGYAGIADKKNQEKKKSTWYTLLAVIGMMIISFLVGSFPVH